MTSVRRAIASDTAAIGALAAQAGLFPEDALANMIAPYFDGADDQYWLVAVDGADVTGVCYCAAERFTEDTYNVLAIAAATGRQRQRIGSALMTAIEEELSRRRGRLLLVETSSDPQFASTQEFYRSTGFEHVATIPDYWAAGER